MVSYTIEWRRATRKDLRRIAPHDVKRIVSAVEALIIDPFPTGSTKLSGSERAYRIRIGDYRVIYEVFDEVLIIEVIKVGHRRDLYRYKSRTKRPTPMKSVNSRVGVRVRMVLTVGCGADTVFEQ